MKLTLVTGNAGKLSEWKRLLPEEFEIEAIDIDLDEIQSMDLEAIVADKAKRAYEIVKKPVLVEDISAGLEKLGGLPGPFIKFFVKSLGEGALHILADREGEKATVICGIAYYDGVTMFTVEGKVQGTVTTPKGENGFGFDKAFIPEGQMKTYGEMTHAEKDAISHRSKAIKQLSTELVKLV
jgi:inosine triphosphate pyrophosphatase